jgi:hypothetical protein
MLHRSCVFASGASEARNLNVLRWARCGFHKMHAGTRYAKLASFASDGIYRSIVHSGASGARNDIALFFMLRWARCGFLRKHVRTRCTEPVFCIQWDLRVMWYNLVSLGGKCRRPISQALVGLVWFPEKARLDLLCRTCVFAFGAICGSPSAFGYIRGMKC